MEKGMFSSILDSEGSTQNLNAEREQNLSLVDSYLRKKEKMINSFTGDNFDSGSV